MVQEIAKDLYMIPVELPRSPLKVLNSYVIKGEGRNLIIDTGFKQPECERSLREGIEELGLDLRKTDFLITHLHADHSGLVPVFVTDDSSVFISRGEIPWLYGESRNKRWANDRMKFKRAGFSEEDLEHLWKAPDKENAPKEFDRYTPLDDGDELEYGDYKLRAVLTPGHTPANMCFWIEKQKIMITGDHVLFDITPNITYWDELDDCLGAYMESLRMVDKYDVELALPGHRGRGDFHRRIAELLEHHEARLAECEKIVAENPGINVYETASKMKWSIRCSSWEDFPRTQKWFAVGECHSHLRHLEKQGRIRLDYSQIVIRCYKD